MIAELWKHGIHPTSRNSPELVRGFVRELNKYEIRRLRERYMRGEFAKREYYDKVDALRRQYPVLALLPSQFLTD